MNTGYLNYNYAQSLAEFGTPIKLPKCGGWVLQRKIPGFPYYDAMGCYPLFCCEDWSLLYEDLNEIDSEWVSLSLVTDPFGDYDRSYLESCFKAIVLPFKQHYIVDLHKPFREIISKNRRKKIRKALRSVNIEICEQPENHLEEWITLYSSLVEKHHITGIRAFSKAAFEKQLNIPGMVMFRALYQDKTIGATLWYIQGEVGYGHLAAFNQTGYELESSYALDAFSMEYFSDKVQWLDLGGSAGTKRDQADGLDLYKRGWATETRPTYFCGRILDHDLYKNIVREKAMVETNYFPAYRIGEFE